MPSYNDMFELSVEDMDLIETALRTTKDTLSKELSTQPNADDAKTVHQIQNLLGRLHNQKVFYRPKKGVYVSG